MWKTSFFSPVNSSKETATQHKRDPGGLEVDDKVHLISTNLSMLSALTLALPSVRPISAPLTGLRCV